jgi:hypothetical protein
MVIDIADQNIQDHAPEHRMTVGHAAIAQGAKRFGDAGSNLKLTRAQCQDGEGQCSARKIQYIPNRNTRIL